MTIPNLKLLNLAFAIITVFTLAGAGFAQMTTATFDTDFQLWNETQFIIPLNKKKDWNAVISVLGRLGNDAGTATDARIGALITKKVNKYFTVGGGYLYRYSNPTFVRKRYESRYIGVATFTIPIDKKWTLVNRLLRLS